LLRKTARKNYNVLKAKRYAFYTPHDKPAGTGYSLDRGDKLLYNMIHVKLY
jgi:hypothetical protein